MKICAKNIRRGDVVLAGSELKLVACADHALWDVGAPSGTVSIELDGEEGWTEYHSHEFVDVVVPESA